MTLHRWSNACDVDDLGSASSTDSVSAPVTSAGGINHSWASRIRRVGSLLTVLIPREIRLRYRESALDVGWALITPIAIMAVYGVVLSQSFNVSGSCAPYLITAWTGLVLWTFFAQAVGTATWSLVSSADLVGKVYFPREALPLAVTGASLLDLAIGATTVVILAFFQDVVFAPVTLTAGVALLSLVIWTAAISIISSVIAVFVRDVTQAVQLILRVGFFATPVMYEPDLIPPAFRWTATWNPIAVTIQAVRDPLLCRDHPAWGLLLLHTCAGLAVLVCGIAYVRSVEGRLADVL